MSKEVLETVDLGLGERLVLQQLLASQQGNLMTMQVIKKFHADLAVTEEELEGIGGNLAQVPMLTAPVPFPFTSWRLGRIREMLRALDASGQVAVQHLSLFEKFLPVAPSTADTDLAEEFAALQSAAGEGDAPEQEAAAE